MTAPNAQTEQNTVLVIRHPKNSLPATFGMKGIGADMEGVAHFFENVSGGVHSGEVWVEAYRGSTNATPAPAVGTLVLSSGSGAVGGVINGVTITATWATSDANSAGLISAAVRASANALVAGLVSASSLGFTATLASVAAGDTLQIQVGNGPTVVFTAITGKPSISGPGTAPTFNIDGNDTADATALAASINAHPAFKGKVYCVSAAAVVTFIQLEQSAVSAYRVQKTGSTITLSAAGAMVNLATVVVWGLLKSKLANAVTLAASGTGVTASGARLTGGVGGDPATPSFYRR